MKFKNVVKLKPTEYPFITVLFMIVLSFVVPAIIDFNLPYLIAVVSSLSVAICLWFAISLSCDVVSLMIHEIKKIRETLNEEE